MSVLLNQGGGLFGGQIVYTTSREPFQVAIQDLNGDGKLDSVTGGGVLGVLLNQGTGTFASSVSFPSSSSFAIGDLNRDDRVDVAVVDHNRSVVGVLLDRSW